MVIEPVHIRLVIVIELLEVTRRRIHEIILHGIAWTVIGAAHRARPVPRVLPLRHMRNFRSLRLICLQQFPFILFDKLLLSREEVRVVGLPALLHAVRVRISRVALIAAHVALSVRLDSIRTRLNVYHVLTHLVEMRIRLMSMLTRTILIEGLLSASKGVLR